MTQEPDPDLQALDSQTGPRTEVGRRILAQDYRGNEAYTVTRADILALEAEAANSSADAALRLLRDVLNRAYPAMPHHEALNIISEARAILTDSRAKADDDDWSAHYDPNDPRWQAALAAEPESQPSPAPDEDCAECQAAEAGEVAPPAADSDYAEQTWNRYAGLRAFADAQEAGES